MIAAVVKHLRPWAFFLIVVAGPPLFHLARDHALHALWPETFQLTGDIEPQDPWME